FVAWLRRDPAFAALQPHYSPADAQPFRRLKVRVRPEIIRMNRPTIRPESGRAAALAPATLARWLAAGHDDAGRPLALLDTRNGFEVDAGRFSGAIDWRLARFGEFPAALAAHREQLEDRTVVSYCTGGIRCEKAALLMREAGIDAWQLEGGILGYFEAVGAAHFDGACFVFDERSTVAAR
ncbi:MAG: rhodanese-like domain-containing protein, partial [Burkholderiaceae bacterium]